MYRILSPSSPSFLILVGLIVLVATPAPVPAGDRLVVHEWGTFTSLQDEQGNALSGINVDDEPVPPFVHNLSPFLLGKPILSHEHWIYRMKAVPRRHPQVTMRLETPVIYFYPPAQSESLRLNLEVQFLGGWLTEYYPSAEVDAPGLHERNFEFGDLSEQTVGCLRWSDLEIGAEGSGPSTDWKVWTAPREVAAATVRSVEGEYEKYLFYRGVGHLPAPLRVAVNRSTRELEIGGSPPPVGTRDTTATIARSWLVDIRDDQRCAFRTVPEFELRVDNRALLATTSYAFAEEEYAPQRLTALRKEMHSELTRAGLFDDEATAMLNTWERAYFTSPGLRLFYVVPRSWTDAVLPLRLSIDADIARVMLGRIELISDRQQELLERLAETPPSNDAWIRNIEPEEAKQRLLAGRIDFGDVGVVVPDDYRLYLGLGRFRNALLIHAEQVARHAWREQPERGERYSQFIDTYALHPFRAPSATLDH